MRFLNLVILVDVLVLTLTGVYGLFWTLSGWLWEVHRAAGWVLLACIPGKMGIAAASLRRGWKANFDRGVMVAVALMLAGTTLGVVVLGLAWSWRLGPDSYPLRQTAISWHWMLALGLLVPFFLHAWRRWPRPRRVDLLSRRAALKMIGLGAASLAGWQLAEAAASLRRLEGAAERISGSRLDGYLSGNRFPVTHTRAAEPSQVDPKQWRLELGGAVARPQTFTYDELLAWPLASERATLDCTLGWYTVQDWQGIPLKDLLELAGAPEDALGVRLESVTGYAHVLPMPEARQVLLATHIGSEALDFWHGFPLRVVAPSRRGWFWVKWLAKVEVISV